MSEVRCLLFSRTGQPLTEIEPEVEAVSWRLNDIGTAVFALAWTDSKCTKSNLQYGNRVLFQFENGLPDWGGVIDPPRTIGEGVVRVNAYTSERLLQHRYTGKNHTFTSTAAGAIYRALLQAADRTESLYIDLGNIFQTGTVRDAEYHYNPLLEAIKELARLADDDFYIEPVYTEDRLTLQAHWYDRRGRDRSQQAQLMEGRNVHEAISDSQGEIANRYYVAGSGTDWGSDRLIGTYTDDDSRVAYGYREYAETQSEVETQQTLDINAESLASDRAEPYRAYSLIVTDDEPGKFSGYRVGDIVGAELFMDSGDWYFDGDLRILAEEWNQDGTCRLEAEEWTG